MKAFYKIEDFIDLDSDDFALSGVSQLNGDIYDMASSSDVLDEINDQFAERSIYVKETDTPMEAFTAMWERWISRRGAQLASAYQVLVTEYNPLENYNRTETHRATGEFTHGETITKRMSTQGTDNTLITPAGSTTTTTPGTTETVTITPAATTKTITPAETTNTITPAETTKEISPAETTTEHTPAETTETTVGTPNTGATVSQKADASIYAFNSSTAVKISEGTTTDTTKQVHDVKADTAGSDVITMQTAGSEVNTTQEPGTEALTVQTAGSEVNTTQTAGSEVTGYTGHNTETIVYNNNGANNRTVNMLDTGSDAHTGKDQTKDDLDIHAYGNIGTVTTQSMGLQELALRKADFVYNAILEFINLYTVYA